MSTAPKVVNLDALPWEPNASPTGWGASRKRIAHAAGGLDLGASMYRVEPGHTAWPRHFHHANEEAILVLSGRATLRVGEHTVVVGPSDWVSLPAGADHAHQLEADQGEAVTYLCLSTMRQPDVTEYPDSGKIGVFCGSAPGASAGRTRAGFWRADDAVSYWTGEEVPRRGGS